MTQEELKKVLEKHKHWLDEDCDGWEEMRADLCYADLSGVNLHDADLSDAKLRYAYLGDADLSGVNLHDADLSGAKLRDAYLCDADLSGANLHDADLRGANLRGANFNGADLSDAELRDVYLSGANLSGANFSGANLRDAYLRDAYLCDADLSGADLRYADLRYADLHDAKNVPFIPYVCPEFGSFIGYKKASGYIVELEILDDAKRLSATSRKCRCNKAKVLRILNYDRTVASVTKVKSNYDNRFIYKVGEFVSVDNFDEDRWNECSAGIHFFINFQEAVDY